VVVHDEQFIARTQTFQCPADLGFIILRVEKSRNRRHGEESVMETQFAGPGNLD